MKKYCMATDLIDEPEQIDAYVNWHRQVWPEIKESIRLAGITDMEIFRYGARLFMIIETDDTFSFERKASLDAANPIVQEWEHLMWKYQKPLPGAKKGEKWVLLEKIFSLKS